MSHITVASSKRKSDDLSGAESGSDAESENLVCKPPHKRIPAIPLHGRPALKPSFGFNRNILFDYLRNPEKHQDCIIKITEIGTVIKDAYPKAKCHLLLIVAEGYLGTVLEVRELVPSYLEKLKLLIEIASTLAAEQENSTGSRILIGFHAVPSLYPMHIHIISDDFQSDRLKTKIHWNSFTTSHFVPADTVVGWLAKGLSVHSQLPSPAALHDMVKNTPLCCNKCAAEFKTMPALKKHLLTH